MHNKNKKSLSHTSLISQSLGRHQEKEFLLYKIQSRTNSTFLPIECVFTNKYFMGTLVSLDF